MHVSFHGKDFAQNRYIGEGDFLSLEDMCVVFWKQPRSTEILESQWHAWENSALFSAPRCNCSAVNTFANGSERSCVGSSWEGWKAVGICASLRASHPILSDPSHFFSPPSKHPSIQPLVFSPVPFANLFQLQYVADTSDILMLRPASLPNRLISVWWWFMMMISMLSLFRPSFFRLDFLSDQDLTSKSMKVPRCEKSKPRNKITRPKHHHLSKLHRFQPLFLWEVDQILLVDTL